MIHEDKVDNNDKEIVDTVLNYIHSHVNPNYDSEFTNLENDEKKKKTKRFKKVNQKRRMRFKRR